MRRYNEESQTMKTLAQPRDTPAGARIRTDWERAEIRALHDRPFNDLLYTAHSQHRAVFDPNTVQLSTLLNIKSGGCPEDCKYCSQSSRYKTDLQNEKLMDKETILDAARRARAIGAERFCMGAAWRDIKDRDVPKLAAIVAAVKALGLETCVTLGMATREQLSTLREAGLDYYNHNIDTSEEYYPQVISTRVFADRLDTLEAVRDAGIKVCCGGILGLGETIEDRISMLHTLATLPEHPQSVPVNMLVPIPGTPFAKNAKIDPLDLTRFIATARLVMPESVIRLSAGRSDLDESTQALAYFAGANSIFFGETLLTTPNADMHGDETLFKKLGIAAGGLQRCRRGKEYAID